MAEVNNSSEYSFNIDLEENTTTSNSSTWILDFSDFTRRDKYRAFKLQSYSSWYLSIVSSIITLLFVIYWLFVLFVHHAWLEYFVCAVSIPLSLLPLWIRTFQSESYEELDAHIRTRLAILESFVTIGFTISTGLTLTMRVMNGQCASINFAYIWGCLPGEMCRTIPSDLSLIMLLLPLFFAIILPCLPPIIVYSAFMLSIVIIAANMSVVRATSSVAWLVCITFMISIIMYFYLKQRLELFMFTCNFQRVLNRANSERERNSNRFVAQMRNLVFGISHDLKSPLTTAGYGIDLLKLSASEIQEFDSNPSETLKQKLDWIDRACCSLEASHQLMIMAINRCTDYTKLTNNLPLQPQVGIMEISRVVKQCVRVVETAFEDSKVEIEYTDCDIENDRIRTDESWFMNNLLCILSNGVSFSATNTATLALKWTNVASLQQLFIDVWNGGEVLTEEDRERCFKSPTLSSTRAAGGVGLGLYCLAQRVGVLGGSYGCCEMVRSGSQGMSFWFTIPVNKSEIADDSTPPRLLMVDQLKILVVDDSKTIVKMLKMMLDKQQHRVDTAANGLEALKQLKAKDFDYHVILMDLQMPVMDGFSAVKLIRASEHSNSRLSRLVVIAMSAGTDEETLTRINDSGFDHFLAKPFTIAAFDQIWKSYYKSRSNAALSDKAI